MPPQDSYKAKLTRRQKPANSSHYRRGYYAAFSGLSICRMGQFETLRDSVGHYETGLLWKKYRLGRVGSMKT